MESETPTKRIAIWRQLSPSNIPDLVIIASKIHPDLPESDAVFLERVQLFPKGCLGLFNVLDVLCGYIISHPIRYYQLPDLNCLLGEIAPNADQYYIHDLAILPEMRGSGLASGGVETISKTVASQYATMCLVSVYGTTIFWGRYGFKRPDTVDEKLEKKLLRYGDDATYLERKNG